MRELTIGLLGMPDNQATPRLLNYLAQQEVKVDFVVYWQPTLQDQRRRVLRKLRNDGVLPTVQRIFYALSRRGSGKTDLESTSVLASHIPHPYMVSNHNSDACREILQDEGVDVLLLGTDAIIRSKILRIPRITTLNAHPAWLPRYRGLGAPIYQMLDGYYPAVSVHQVDEGVDTGSIFVREWFEFETMNGLAGLYDLIAQHQARLLAQVIHQIKSGNLVPLDTFLEPSAMTRGVSPHQQAHLDQLLQSGRLKLRPLSGLE